MNISKIKGMKYPDDYFIKYFFKKQFNARNKLKFIEFGSSNGNNLMLPYNYGHDVIGIDFDKDAIEDAHSNFSNIENTNAEYKFHIDDMRNFAKKNKNIKADVLLLPNVVNYILKDDFISFLKVMKANNNISKKASFFIRCRTPKDFRFGLGNRLELNTYKLPSNYNLTGEAGCLNRFYNESELISIMKEYLNLTNYTLMSSDSQNLQKEDTIVLNSDIILWGNIS